MNLKQMNNIVVETENNQNDSFYVRKKVFIEEQGYKNEFDQIDDNCKYVTVKMNGSPVATGRVYKNPDVSDSVIFGRIAVLKEYRGFHIGKLVLESLENIAIEIGAKEIILSSQEYAVPFYEKSGFVLADNIIYYDEGNPHRKMKKIL